MMANNGVFVIYSFVIFANLKYTKCCTDPEVQNFVRKYWHEIDRCQNDPNFLIETYNQIEAMDQKSDVVSQYLGMEVKEALIEKSVEFFQKAFNASTFNDDPEVDRLAKNIFPDMDLAVETFGKFIDAVYTSRDKMEMAKYFFSNKNAMLRIVLLSTLSTKPLTVADFEPRLSALIVYYLRILNFHKDFTTFPPKLKTLLTDAVSHYPVTLQNLYYSKVAHVLNIGHWEYLYAPRDVGPISYKRYGLTWTDFKNETDFECDLTLEFDESGNVAFGSNYDGVLRSMYIDEEDERAYFWLKSVDHDRRWWQVESYDDFLVFRDTFSKKLMCADVPYDAARRIVSLGAQKSLFNVPSHCRWFVNPVLKIS